MCCPTKGCYKKKPRGPDASWEQKQTNQHAVAVAAGWQLGAAPWRWDVGPGAERRVLATLPPFRHLRAAQPPDGMAANSVLWMRTLLSTL